MSGRVGVHWARLGLRRVFIAGGVRLKKKLKILGYYYQVRYSPLQEVGGMDTSGRCHTGKQLIFVDPLLCKQAQESTVLHEVIEALNYHLELGLAHSTIMSLEAGLYQVLTYNNLLAEVCDG